MQHALSCAQTDLIEAVRQQVTEYYVFPEVGKQMADFLGANAERYAEYTSDSDLCRALTSDLQAICSDKHMRVIYNEEPALNRSGPLSPETIAYWNEGARLDNGGFYKVERLKGNVGYIETTSCPPAEVVGEMAAAAMAFVANTSALILDLRRNGGGQNTFVQFLCSYFFEWRTHLNTVHYPAEEREVQWWTLPHVPGKKYLGRPVYVLTSGKTFSAAEEIAYNLQQLKRATIVGEVTRGGAHPVRPYRLTPHILITTPWARSVNPVTKTNWEGTGVQPDIAVPVEDALNRAYAEALRQVIAGGEKNEDRAYQDLVKQAQEALAGLEA